MVIKDFAAEGTFEEMVRIPRQASFVIYTQRKRLAKVVGQSMPYGFNNKLISFESYANKVGKGINIDLDEPILYYMNVVLSAGMYYPNHNLYHIIHLGHIDLLSRDDDLDELYDKDIPGNHWAGIAAKSRSLSIKLYDEIGDEAAQTFACKIPIREKINTYLRKHDAYGRSIVDIMEQQLHDEFRDRGW